MNILQKIITNTKSKIEVRKVDYPLKKMKVDIESFDLTKTSFKSSIVNKDQAIIAEIKKASPSAGIISEDFNPISKAKEYEVFGASA